MTSNMLTSQWMQDFYPSTVGGIVIYAVLVVVFLQIIGIIYSAIYNLYFHPLSRFRGPRTWIAFPILKRIAQLRGQLDFEIREFHNTYGEVVRSGPDILTFTSPKAWKDIYGHGHPELPKHFSTGVRQKEGNVTIINANAKDHARLRRAMLPAFSDKALSRQEPLITVYVDLLIQRLGEVASSGQATNMVTWYTYTTFDLIGDLAYGEAFDGLKEGKQNQWVTNIKAMMRLFPILGTASMYPLLGKLLLLFTSGEIRKSRAEHLRLATELARKRIKNKDQEHRGDFMDFMMHSQGTEHGLSDKELTMNSDVLIIAGSETTATLLCGVTYYLLITPRVFETCVEEVRTAFDSDEAIDFKSASTKLPYMLACLDEALRLFPPVPSALSRRTLPGQVTMIDEYEIPPNTAVGVHHLSTYHSPRNFHDPQTFHPERWLPEAQKNPESPFFNDRRDACKPFSFGPRDCVGRNLAYHEMRLILARVLWNFDLNLSEATQDWVEKQRIFALWEKPPLMVNIARRTDAATAVSDARIESADSRFKTLE